MIFETLPLHSGMSLNYINTNDNALQIFTISVIPDQILFILIFFTLMLVIVAVCIYLVFLKNKRLREDLDEKSRDLREAFEILSKNNKKLQNANRDLIQKNIQQKEFINIAAHELRTPTQAITGYVELIDELFKDLLNKKIETALGDQGKEETILRLTNYQQLVLNNATRLSDLINDLLDIAKLDLLDNNNIQLNKENRDLIKEINDFKINYQIPRKKGDKNNDIIIKYDDKILSSNKLMVDVDGARLYQILNNIVGNAFKFSNESNNITISIKKDIYNKPVNSKNGNYSKNNDKIVISISDEGKGISQAMLPHLFERFATDSESGTGLGLYITKKLVEAHGGTIWGFNNDNGKGSTFEFTLPISK
jgi:signal transduction histidine kinase